MKNNINKYHIATAIALLFHVIGFIGIVYFDRDFFIRSTVVNLLLMFVLLLYTQKINSSFLSFLVVCFTLGVVVEVIGTNTGWLFGKYSYGDVLGYQVKNVPLIIGINWIIVIYCSGVSIQTLLNKILDKLSDETGRPRAILKALSVIVDGATLALLFDWLMEPVAIKLGFWQWGDGGLVPLYNYLCWFIISAVLLAVFHYSNFNKQNKFAVNLLLIQILFFLLLRTFL